MKTLKNADCYVDMNRIHKDKKPAFHLTTPVGWMNDPNGFSVFNNKIHLFYQFHPYSEVWGPMHWGHYETTDFLKWDELPTALAPDMDYDAAGCFSGTALVVDGKHILFYTGVIEQDNEDGTKEVFQNQCIAVGDGRNYEKGLNNPVLKGDIMPADCSRADFRDPKVWKDKNGSYYLLAGNKTYDGKPQVVLFQSLDMQNWNFVSVFAKDESNRFGAIWECPDYFQNGNWDVLIVSPQDMQADEEFHNGNNVVCFLGKVDHKLHQFHYDKAVSLDYGFDFYAAQTIETLDKRRVLIAWMQSWDSTNTIPRGQKWAGMMTIPRELEIKDDMILQNPVKELEKYRKDEVSLETTIQGKTEIEGIRGRILDLTIELKESEFEKFSISLAKDEQHVTSFSYSSKERTLVGDRTFAGWIRDTNCVRTMPVKNANGLKKLRFIMDKNSIELFVNDGEQVFSTVIYTPLSADGIVFECNGAANVKITKYALCFD